MAHCKQWENGAKHGNRGVAGSFFSTQKAPKRGREGGFSVARSSVVLGSSGRERGEREGESVHGEILNRDPWWLTERGGSLFRQQPHGGLGAETTVESPTQISPMQRERPSFARGDECKTFDGDIFKKMSRLPTRLASVSSPLYRTTNSGMADLLCRLPHHDGRLMSPLQRNYHLKALRNKNKHRRWILCVHGNL